MRKLEDHIVSGDQAVQLEIEVTDQPGQGGANHKYETQEALLAIVIDRLRSFQSHIFACRENAIALEKCEEALMWLQRRTVARIKRGVEGTHEK